MQQTSDHSMKAAGPDLWRRQPRCRPAAVRPLLTGLLALAVLAVPLAACAGGSGAATAAAIPERPAAGADAAAATDAAEPEDDTPVLVGEVSRAEVEAAVPDWVAAQMEAAPDLAAVEALAGVEPGAEVTVYLGTWCSDSRRELARLWRGFDDAGVGVMVELPFDLTYVAVDRDKAEPAERLEGVGLEYVPTFVVARGGGEVGRVVEISPHGIEHDLLALLTGEAEGVVSGREDLGGAGREAILDDGSAAEDGAGG